MRLGIAIVSLMFGLLTNAMAADPHPAATLYSKYLAKENISGELRKDYAADLLRQFAPMIAAIPILSPSQEAWLKSEFDDEIARNGGLFSTRSVNATFSKEYNIRMARIISTNIEFTLRKLSSGNIREQLEIALWMETAQFFTDMKYGRSISSLSDQNLIRLSDLPYKEFIPENFVSIGNSIIRWILMPYYSGRWN